MKTEMVVELLRVRLGDMHAPMFVQTEIDGWTED